MSLLHLLFGFSGRINRGKFWLAVVLWIVFWVIALPVCLLAGSIILGLHLLGQFAAERHATGSRSWFSMALDYLGLVDHLPDIGES